MATGFDELLGFLLCEIGLCGKKGASSADFRHFIQKFYTQNQDDHKSSNHGDSNAQLGRNFYERMWEWVTDHPDIRIVYQKEVRRYTLSEFEAAELHATGTFGGSSSTSLAQATHVSTNGIARPSKALSALGGALRQRLLEEGEISRDPIIQESHVPEPKSLRQSPRNIPQDTHVIRSAMRNFDEPDPSITTPRLYASQNGIWQALTGHGIDLKKVPSKEFVLLSLIAAQGSEGITQPDLTALSGQDKRSVPHRTSELERKNYITKVTVQSYKQRTSLLIHKRFVSRNQSLESCTVDNVYQKDLFVVRGLPQLLYNKLGKAGIVPTRSLRTKLNVPMTTWNKRATQGALIRLDQSRMIRRFRVRKKESVDSWATCIQVLREPNDEDLKNLSFRRTINATEEEASEILDEDGDGDSLMRDLEVDMLDNTEAQTDTRVNTQHAIDSSDRIPPQWTPDRFLANTIFHAAALGGVAGWDSMVLRDRVVGPFWRRPIESYIVRMMDDWERTQPMHLRHLATIRDQHMTSDKKFLHYVYRTYANFEKAVEANVAHWAGVSNPLPKDSSQDAINQVMLDAWGFPIVNPEELVNGCGSATLSEAGSALVNPHRYGPRWDNRLAEEIGYKKTQPPKPRLPGSRPLGRPKGSGKGVTIPIPKIPKLTKPTSQTSLTPQQRISLGLKPTGRLTKNVSAQIRAHRQKTGDPTSVPDRLEDEPTPIGQLPLMTAEDRVAAGLPARGRLGKEKENQIREERGLPTNPSLTKQTKPVRRFTKATRVLSDKQRIALGWTAHGRMPQDLVEGLRRERENDVAPEDSEVILQFMKYMRACKASKDAQSAPTEATEDQTTAPVEDETRPKEDFRALLKSVFRPSATRDTASPALSSFAITGKRKKRKAEKGAISSPSTKRARSMTQEDSEGVASPDRSESSTKSFELGDDRTGNTTMTPALDGTAVEQLAPARTEDGIITSVERQQPSTVEVEAPGKASTSVSPSVPRLLLHIVLQPDVSKLDPQARAAFDRYNNRSSRGLYINPYAKQKVPRGRPRKACIATFKLPQLSNYAWFVPEMDRLQPTAAPRDSAVESVKLPQTNVTNEVDGEVGPGRALSVDASLQADKADPPSIETATQTEDAAGGSHTPTSEVVSRNSEMLPASKEGHTEEPAQEQSVQKQSAQEPPTHQQSVNEHPDNEQPVNEHPVQEQPKQPLPSSVSAVQVSNDNPAANLENSEPSLETETLVPAKPEEPRRETLPVPRMSTVWTAINTPTRREPSSYKSPYPTTANTEPTLPDQAPTTNTDASVPTSSAATVTSVVDGNPSASNGVQNGVRKTRVPAVPKPRRKEPGGSVMIFRREIILEIIDRCGGVFPDSAEIGRPFQTLWKERHGRLTAPSRNTVSDTLRDMAKIPDFGLKRWTFYVRNKNTPTMARKTIIARVHLTPESPEVQTIVRNMANCARDKSHQYFPEGIHDILGEELEKLKPMARKNEGIILNQLNPKTEAQIKERRKQQRAERKEREKAERMARNAEVEQASSKQRAVVDGSSHTKRARLASLNDKGRQVRRLPQDKARVDTVAEADASESDVVEVTSSGKIPLVWMRPVVASMPDSGSISEDGSEAEESDVESEGSLSAEKAAPSPPPVESPAAEAASPKTTVKDTVTQVEPIPEKGKKRVRISEPRGRIARKKSRLNITGTASVRDTGEICQPGNEDDVPCTSDAEEESEEHEEAAQPKTTKKRIRISSKRQQGKPGPPPTLLERLTGLTGDPNDPIYQPPQHRHRPPRPGRPWRDRKRVRVSQQKNERVYNDVADPVDKFKKLFCTFVVASSMSGEEGAVDWSLVKKIYANDRFFDVVCAQKLWAWMQSNMTAQVSELSADFQSHFLEAYEAGKISAIEDPSTYDWPTLVQWAVRKCTYPEIPLPMLREALRQFTVDESSYKNLDRVSWYKAATADRARTLLQLQHSFTAPLHRSREAPWSPDDKVLKARSWIRSNTATSQALYDPNLAHDKFKELGESVLVSVVGDLVQKQHLRMRKLKRLLPGRNYSFTKRFAKKYMRPFQLDDFLSAVEVKKNMDAAFANEDPTKRYYSISRSEEDGSFTAIMTMVSEGTVKLAPQIPPVNNEFGAPLPRISVWGFCEGDYIHRAIDRERLFWDIHVVPTVTYRFGNPLQPLPSPSTDKDGPAVWPALPDPPLPGKHDASALLPIWSSIDGQSITWPWWYRILNLVLQPLIFIAGATAVEVHSHCPEDTAELFEVELVLGWLESINAVKKTVGGGYITLPGFWASFNDKLLDTEDDWFGEHVKRRSKNHEKQVWRTEYNLRHSTLQARNTEQSEIASAEDAQADANMQDIGAAESSTGRQILKNPKRQYRITKKALDAQKTPKKKNKPASASAPTSSGYPVATQPQTHQDSVAEQSGISVSQTPGPANTQGQDVDMTDADADVDAEGEIDDGMY